MYAPAIIFLVILQIVNINEADDDIFTNVGKFDVVFLIDQSRFYGLKAPDLIKMISYSPVFSFDKSSTGTRMGYVMCGMPDDYWKKLELISLDEMVNMYVPDFSKEAQKQIDDDNDYYNTWERWTKCMDNAFTLVFKNVAYDKMRPKLLVSKLAHIHVLHSKTHS